MSKFTDEEILQLAAKHSSGVDCMPWSIGEVIAFARDLLAKEAEPFGYFHELLRDGKGSGIWLGAKTRAVVEASYDEGEVSKEIFALYSSPQIKEAESAASAVPEGWPTDEMIDRGAREGWAVTRHTNGPRTLANYASEEIMRDNYEHARVVITAALAASPTPPANTPTIFLDEIDAAKVGEEFIFRHAPGYYEVVRSEDGGTGQMPRVKYTAVFDHNDVLLAAYLLSRDALNRTQLTLFPTPPAKSEPSK